MISAPIHVAIRSRPDATRVAHRLSPMWGRQTLSDRGMWRGGICCTMSIWAVCCVGDPKPEEHSALAYYTGDLDDSRSKNDNRKLMTDPEYQEKRAKIIAEL